MVKKIGILALQGNFQNHKLILDHLGVESTYVRYSSNLDHINGLTVPREIFTDIEKYNSIKNDIKNIKQIFSSSSLTSLQNTHVKQQKWPLLNLVRQIFFYTTLLPKGYRGAL